MTGTESASQAGMARDVVFLHGFTQAGVVWHSIAAAIARGGHRVTTPNLPGHGQSAVELDSADLWRAADSITAPVPAVYVGYSLGARVALHAALAHPQKVAGLVLVGGRIGFADPAAAEQRRQADELLARRLENPADKRDFAVVIDEWLASPVNERLLPAQQQRDLRLANRPEGLAASLRHCGTGTQADLRGRLAELAMPVLVTVGEHDLDAVKADAKELVDRIGPNARFLEVAGAGHSVPFEKPDRFVQIIREFMGNDLVNL